ncbi:DNA sulfur modification protein DndD [[Phormidium] sp. ETS-05]|uniref:DNA sulfur modification protein DndD n=1 Tax=[Phormidium] sp. ETS-05 TaxID=222819 RepID=UPI0018EF2518|nr:DNA sulfur modification protein DndD [[Phormidium] sp. ETS-05]
MIFLELVLQNFGPYRGRHVINLQPEWQGENRPIILFGGMNGGGKTTLMDAIRLVLYGPRAQCSKRGNLAYGEFLKQAVNSQTPPTEETCVELVFEHVLEWEKVRFRVQRKWTRQPKNGKDTLGILREEWPDEGLKKIWDEWVEGFLPLGISNLFLFDGEQVKELAETDEPTPAVAEAIRALLGLELADRLEIDLDILVSRKQKEIAEIKQRQDLDVIDKKLSQQKEDLATAEAELKQAQEYWERTKINQERAAERFRLEGGKIAAESQQLKQQVEDLKASAETARQEMRDIAAGVMPLALIEPLLLSARSQGEKEVRAAQAKMALDVLLDRDSRLLDFLSNLDLEGVKLDKIQGFLAAENQSLREDSLADVPWEGAGELVEQLDNLVKVLLPGAKQRSRVLSNQVQQLEAQMETAEKQLALAASPEAYSKLEKDLKKAQTEAGKAAVDVEFKKRRCRELEGEIAKTKKELDNYIKDNIDRRNADNLIVKAARVKETLKLFREQLTLKKLNKLENEVGDCFRYLLHKSDLVHRVAIDHRNFSISLYDPQGELLPKHQLSAGEKQLLAIAFLWGLAKVSGRHLPVVIDTPLSRLDSEHRQNLVEKYFPAASHQVILLSTDTEIGQTEVGNLRERGAIAREYLLEYNSAERETVVKEGYFW